MHCDAAHGCHVQGFYTISSIWNYSGSMCTHVHISTEVMYHSGNRPTRHSNRSFQLFHILMAIGNQNTCDLGREEVTEHNQMGPVSLQQTVDNSYTPKRSSSKIWCCWFLHCPYSTFSQLEEGLFPYWSRTVVHRVHYPSCTRLTLARTRDDQNWKG